MDVSLLLNETSRNRLKKLFQQLDTDRDGYDKKKSKSYHFYKNFL